MVMETGRRSIVSLCLDHDAGIHEFIQGSIELNTIHEYMVLGSSYGSQLVLFQPGQSTVQYLEF